MTTRAVDAPDPKGTPWKDTPRGQEIRKRADRPSAVEVADIAKTIYCNLVTMNVDRSGAFVTDSARRESVSQARALIAEAERQLGEQGEADGHQHRWAEVSELGQADHEARFLCLTCDAQKTEIRVPRSG